MPSSARTRDLQQGRADGEQVSIDFVEIKAGSSANLVPRSAGFRTPAGRAG
jgi:hypothetical protein